LRPAAIVGKSVAMATKKMLSQTLNEMPQTGTGHHILVVDDDGQIRMLVSKFLRANGYRVTSARDSVEMGEVLQNASPDLIVLDLMLPGKNGLEICRDLRRSSDTPVIMLTAKGDETDRIVGLEVGADDYLPKPFNPRELLARIKAVMRRGSSRPATGTQATSRHVSFDGWRIDLLRRELHDPKGVIIDLSAGEFDLLLAFVEAPNRILNRDYLMDHARNRSMESFDRAIDVQISRLRKKLEPGGEVIKTVRGAGYLFLPTVARG
jgi:two-component system, OmpR family, response regulator